MQNGKLYAKLTRSFLRKWCKYPYIINIRLFSAKLVTILIVGGQPSGFIRFDHACKRPVWVDKSVQLKLGTNRPKKCQKIRRNKGWSSETNIEALEKFDNMEKYIVWKRREYPNSEKEIRINYEFNDDKTNINIVFHILDLHIK